MPVSSGVREEAGAGTGSPPRASAARAAATRRPGGERAGREQRSERRGQAACGGRGRRGRAAEERSRRGGRARRSAVAARPASSAIAARGAPPTPRGGARRRGARRRATRARARARSSSTRAARGGRARAAEEARSGQSRPGAPFHNERVWKQAAAAAGGAHGGDTRVSAAVPFGIPAGIFGIEPATSRIRCSQTGGSNRRPRIFVRARRSGIRLFCFKSNEHLVFSFAPGSTAHSRGRRAVPLGLRVSREFRDLVPGR